MTTNPPAPGPAPASPAPLSPTARTTATRTRERMATEREDLERFLGAGLVAHLGISLDEHPVVLPVAYALDLDGPDEQGTLYLHGSVAAGWMGQVVGATVCVTVTELDGLVLARSGMHHSMNYRSAVVLGRARLVEDEAERARALDLVVDHVVPGRSATLRAATRKELSATRLLAVPLAEASLRARSGGPRDDADDLPGGRHPQDGVWSGVIELGRATGMVLDSPDALRAGLAQPAHVRARAESLGCGA